jgi:hypothetical protein
MSFYVYLNRAGFCGPCTRPYYKNLLRLEVANLKRVAFPVTDSKHYLDTRKNQEHGRPGYDSLMPHHFEVVQVLIR